MRHSRFRHDSDVQRPWLDLLPLFEILQFSLFVSEVSLRRPSEGRHLRAVAHCGHHQFLEAGLLFCEGLLLHDPEVVYLLSFHQKLVKVVLLDPHRESLLHGAIRGFRIPVEPTQKGMKLEEYNRGGMPPQVPEPSPSCMLVRNSQSKLTEQGKKRNCVVSGLPPENLQR